MRLIAIVMTLVLIGCSDRYRFPCQDPQNWHKAHCNPPLCKADETCTKYLIEVNR